MGILKRELPDGTKESGPYLSLGQMQTAEGYNVIYTDKGIGWDLEIPMPFASRYAMLKSAFGYLNSTRVVLLPDAVLVLDVAIDPFNKGGVTDTFLYGEEAVKEYAKYFEIADMSEEPDSSEEPEPVEGDGE